MKMNQMFATVPLKRWLLLYPSKLTKETSEFLNLMKEVAPGLAFEMSDPKLVELSDTRTATYAEKLKECLAKDPKFVMLVVPDNAGDRYAAIKRLTCIDRACPTQVITAKTMTPKKGGNPGSIRSIATKVVVQINCKLGK